MTRSDVTAIWPGGGRRLSERASQPSVAAMDVRITRLADPDQPIAICWPKLRARPIPVTRPGGPRQHPVYPMPGTGIAVFQQEDNTYVITPPTITMGFTLVGNVITVSGQPSPGEYLTLVVDDAHVYSQTGASTSVLLNNLLTLTAPVYDHNGILIGTAGPLSTDYPGAVATATTLTVPFGHSLVVRQGGKATLGKVTHRQRNSIMVTVWSPTQAVRSTLAAAVDNAIKLNIKVAMPDTSQALVIYIRTNVLDDRQSTAIYRRLDHEPVRYRFRILCCVVTSVTTSIANPSNTAIATA